MASIIGTNKNNILQGTADNDTILGLGGNDILHGHAGNDKLYGGSGADKLYGDAGRDNLYGNSGPDALYGGTGSDNLYGGTGANTLRGGGGISPDNVNQDTYYLVKGHANPDTVVIPKGESVFQLSPLKIPINFDRIYGLDRFDKIDLDSKKIMPNASVNPADANDTLHFDAFKIKNGVITLQDSQHHNVNINTVALAGEAYKFIIKNCLPINLDKAVALQVNVSYPPVAYNSYNLNHNPAHTVVLEAHSDASAGITAVDIIGNVTATIAHQII